MSTPNPNIVDAIKAQFEDGSVSDEAIGRIALEVAAFWATFHARNASVACRRATVLVPGDTHPQTDPAYAFTTGSAIFMISVRPAELGGNVMTVLPFRGIDTVTITDAVCRVTAGNRGVSLFSDENNEGALRTLAVELTWSAIRN